MNEEIKLFNIIKSSPADIATYIIKMGNIALEMGSTEFKCNSEHSITFLDKNGAMFTITF